MSKQVSKSNHSIACLTCIAELTQRFSCIHERPVDPRDRHSTGGRNRRIPVQNASTENQLGLLSITSDVLECCCQLGSQTQAGFDPEYLIIRFGSGADVGRVDRNEFLLEFEERLAIGVGNGCKEEEAVSRENQ